MSPSKPESEETVTDKSLGHTIRYLFSLLKDPKNLAIAAFVLKLGYDQGKQFQAPKDEYWGKDEIRQIIKQEVGPLQAGFKAYVRTLPDRQQVMVLRAMASEVDANKKAN